MAKHFPHSIPAGIIALLCTHLSEHARGAAAQVMTWRNDGARSGINNVEQTLTPAVVNSTNFGQLFRITVDGVVMAQPLYLSGVPIPNNGTHNVVYIATERDSVYACDADSGVVLWHSVLLGTGETPTDNHNCPGIALSEIGITATPLISNGAIFIQATTKDAGGNDIHRLHKLDISTGAELSGSPVEITATYPGSGSFNESSNGIMTFMPSLHFDRAALALVNGVVYTTWTSYCDAGAYNGWIIGYDASSMQQVAALPTAPNGRAGSIWQSGAGPAVDANGNLYCITGNGTLDQQFDSSGFPINHNFGNSFIKLSLAGGAFSVTDYFAPFDSQDEISADKDLGSGGVLLLPDLQDAKGNTRHLLVGGGKDEHLYVLDRDKMGKYTPNASSNSYAYQDMPSTALKGGLFSTPVYFNGSIFAGPLSQPIKAFPVTNALVAQVPSSETLVAFGYPGTSPAISANQNQNGILWAVRDALYAFNPQNLSTQLYSSEEAANGRDHIGSTNRFAVPMIANGKVYIGAQSSVVVFGLLNPPRVANISTRAQVGTADDVVIAGFIIQGSVPRQLVIRGLGPSISSNGAQLPGALQDPLLELHDNSGRVIATNDNWGDSPQATQISADGLAPSDTRESAMLVKLDPGAYTAILRGATQSTGIGLVEFYDVTGTYNSTLANISTRGFVGTDNDVLIGGFIVQGVAAQEVIVRALGPDLANSGIAGPLTDPVLELHSGDGTLLAVNDNWHDGTPNKLQASGLEPQDNNDAAIAITLPAGSYTAVVRGANDSTGVALVEAYAVK